MPHIDIAREEHYGKKVWVHRNGTSRAFGPERMKDHPLFGNTGEPAFVPSSMSTPAFLGVGTDLNESSFFSSSHGTGLSKTKTENDIPQNREELLRKMERKGVMLFNGQSNITIKQDSAHYKDVSKVVRGIEENNILKMVVKMQPVAVIMY
jgi:tRNA-splicing ligase RtcB